MTTLQIQSFIGGKWHDCATLTLKRPEAGIGSPSGLEYDFDYFLHTASVDNLKGEVRDLRAVSVRHPVDLGSHKSERWLPFVLDLIPQGAMRRRFAAERGWQDGEPQLDHLLLLHGAGSPVGNLRVMEARREDEGKLKGAQIKGVPFESILTLNDDFRLVWEKAGLTAGGSEGVQGDWPKILMTRSLDGLWYPDAVVPDHEATEHVLVKRAHPKATHNSTILRAESGYLELARNFGLKVGKRVSAGNDVLIIPRFDRELADGAVVRHGQESLASAIGTSAYGAEVPHTRYVDALRRHSTSAEVDIVEYVRRDVLNLVTGNTDNHGRNTALQKHLDGRVSLTPLFDFAPMKIVQDGPRVTRWTNVTTDHAPDWVAVAEAVCADVMDPSILLTALKESESFIRELPFHARAVGIDEEVIAKMMVRHEEIADTLAAIPTPGPKP